jgi:hypothetical protein
MKILVLNKGAYRDFRESLNYSDEHIDLQDQKTKSMKYGNVIASAPRTVLPGGVFFHFDAALDICTLSGELRSFYGIDYEQVLTEGPNGIYYSGPLMWEWCKKSPFHHPPSWNFRKILVFKSGEIVARKSIAPGTSKEMFGKGYPDADELIEVWCVEWEYYDKYIFNYWFEWRGPCLWGGNIRAHEKYDYAINIDKLPLSARMKERVEAMIRWHDTALDWDNPGGDSPWTDEESERFKKAATELYEDLKKELGDEFEVRRR